MKILLRLFIWVSLTVVAVAQPIRPWLNPGISDPRNLTGLAAWYDTSTTSSMLNAAGTTVTTGQGVRLIADKSGNSAVNCLCLNGVAGNYASAPDSPALDITGNIDIRVDAAANDWSPPSGIQALVAKWTTTGNQRSYQLLLLTTGALQLDFSTDGTNAALRQIASNATIAASDFSRMWVRATCDFATSTARFYTSPDGLTWTQLGTDRTLPFSGSTFTSTAALEIGSDASGASSLFAGRIYRAIIKSGIDGTKVFDADFTAQSKLATSFTESSANAATVTINATGDLGARIAGERDLYQATAAKQPVYLPYTGTKYGYLNGVAGNYPSTPNSAAINAVTTDFTITARLDTTFNSGGIQNILAKRNAVGTAAVTQFQLRINATGELLLVVSNGASTSFGGTSTSAVPADAKWVKATFDADNGASGSTTKFWYSTADARPSGAGWTQLGSDVVFGTVMAGINVVATPLTVGVLSDDGAAQRLAGKVYLVEFATGIDGAAVAVFDPQSSYTSGTTFTASTGEVWTVNGGAHIVTRTGLYFDGSNDYLKTAAFSYSQPESVYGVLEQVTWTANDYVYDGISTNTLNLSQDASTGSPTVEIYAGSGSVQNSSLPIKTAGCVGAVFNDAASGLRVNRNAVVSGSIGTSNAGGFTLAARGDGAARWSNIFASELILRSAADNTATQDAFILYEQIKWGIQ